MAGTILASAIIDDAEALLHDSTNDAWTAARHLANLNIIQKAMVIFKPDLSITNASVQLASGTKQTLPDSLVQFQGLTRNMGIDGSTPGNTIVVVDKLTMDSCIPDWHTVTASATVQHYMYDPKDPKNYYVYPPQPTSSQGYVERVISSLPADVALIGNAITLDDVNAPIYIDGICYMALIQDAPHSLHNHRLALEYWNKFVTALDRKDLREKIESPKVLRGNLPQMPTGV